jgi:DNA-binding LytR/AlgR family response regulator
VNPAAPRPTALIADDEPLLVQGLRDELAELWPELEVVATAHDGIAALSKALATKPDICFLDIRMPGHDGIEVAQALVEDWPADDAAAFPLLVFVTAYDRHALAAFDARAVDYLVKPVERTRLARTVQRLRGLLARPRAAQSQRPPSPPGAAWDRAEQLLAQTLAETIERLRGLKFAALAGDVSAAAVPSPDASSRLTVIQAQAGATVHLVPIEDVLYFEAADKYVRVVTAEREYLIRTSLRELLPRLDPALFWQVHRSTVVQARCVASAQREESGIVRLRLRGHKDVLTASRLYAHLFRGM